MIFANGKISAVLAGLVCALLLASCRQEPSEVVTTVGHDAFISCFKPDNTTYFDVEAGYGCHQGDHAAYPCYLADGTVVGIQRGNTGPNAECRARGGTLYGQRQHRP